MKPRTLWLLVLIIALLGAWLLFETLPGASWPAWVGVASLGLTGVAGCQGNRSSPVMVTGVTATLLAGATMVTSNTIILVLACGGVILFLAMQMLFSTSSDWRPLTLPFALLAPVLAFGNAIIEAIRRIVGLTNELRSPSGGAIVRGGLLTLPVLIIFGLLLSGADPTFAAWRNGLEEWVARLSFLPRTIFFFALFTIVLGAFGFAAAGRSVSLRTPVSGWQILGTTERLMLLGSVAALFWIFLAVQLSYLFGTSPSELGSGVTYAEFARRGFAELTVVSTAAVLLIVVGEVLGRPAGDRTGALRAITLVVLVAVMLLVTSAFRRVLLYEEAYGFTVARLYGKTYMISVGLGLVALGLEIARGFEPGRLFRRALTIVTILFIGLAYWNHEGWIASRNLDRFAAGGDLDVPYLTRELSPDAIPVLAARLGELPPAERQEIQDEVRQRYAEQGRNFDRRWYEWNLSRTRAQESLKQGFGIHFP